jgi:hypothetical protein
MRQLHQWVLQNTIRLTTLLMSLQITTHLTTPPMSSANHNTLGNPAKEFWKLQYTWQLCQRVMQITINLTTPQMSSANNNKLDNSTNEFGKSQYTWQLHNKICKSQYTWELRQRVLQITMHLTTQTNYLLTYDSYVPLCNRFHRGEWITRVSGGWGCHLGPGVSKAPSPPLTQVIHSPLWNLLYTGT